MREICDAVDTSFSEELEQSFVPTSLSLPSSLPGSALPTHSAETKQEYPPPAVSLAPGMVTAEVGDDLLAYYCTGAM